jgi:imidazolonepropionase-like amidohydrolase
MIGLLLWSALQSPAVVITNATVVDVENGRTQPGQSILLRQGRIVEVGSTVRSMAGAIPIDGTGRYVIPGLWDMHVHAAMPYLDTLFLPLLVANGVTGVREMWSRVGAMDTVRESIARGALVGPRIYGSGNLVDGVPPIWPGSLGVETPEAGRRAVDSLAASGAGFIKVYSRLSPETFRAIAEQARRRGITLVGAAEASELGQRTVEHLTTITSACSREETALREETAAAVATAGRWDSAGKVQRGQVTRLLNSYDERRCRELARRFVKNETWMVPTIVVLRSVASLDDTTLAADPRMVYIPASMSRGWDPRQDFRFRMLTPQDWAQRKAAYQRQREIIRLFRSEGVRFLAGTDLANPFIFPGFSLHEEMDLMVQSGFTPLQALQAATIEPARFLGGTDSLGTVAAGSVADLVLLDANPLEDIRNTTRIATVILGGQVLDRARLDQLLATAKERVRTK